MRKQLQAINEQKVIYHEDNFVVYKDDSFLVMKDIKIRGFIVDKGDILVVKELHEVKAFNQIIPRIYGDVIWKGERESDFVVDADIFYSFVRTHSLKLTTIKKETIKGIKW